MKEIDKEKRKKWISDHRYEIAFLIGYLIGMARLIFKFLINR